MEQTTSNNITTDEEYDAIILGTGIKECILATLLSASGKRILHIDRYANLGGRCPATANLDEMYKGFFEDGCSPPQEMGNSADWKIDLAPKFLMADGDMSKLLLHTSVNRGLKFKAIDESYSYNKKMHKVPAIDADEIPLESTIFDPNARRNFRSFINWAKVFQRNNIETWKGLNPNISTMQQVYNLFGLKGKYALFLIGYALALYKDNNYETQPFGQTIERVSLYIRSRNRLQKSPYLYPVGGISTLLNAFAFSSGRRPLMNQETVEIEMENGRAIGVKLGGKIVRGKQIYCDPIYALSRVKEVGKVVRAICILSAPIPNTNNAKSAQIIIPGDEEKKYSNIYIACCSNVNNVAPPGWYLASVSTTIVSKTPQNELKPGLDLLGNISEEFMYLTQIFEPVDLGEESQIFISKSADATTNFDSTISDVLDLYKRGTGKDVDFSMLNTLLSASDD